MNKTVISYSEMGNKSERRIEETEGDSYDSGVPLLLRYRLNR